MGADIMSPKLKINVNEVNDNCYFFNANDVK